MTNAELIATLRGENYFVTLLHDAADALEAADKRINELTTKCHQLQDEVDNYEKRIKELEDDIIYWQTYAAENER